MAGPKKVVVFEDNPDIQLILRVFLQKRGYDPVILPDGSEGLEMVRKHAPVLILMDIIMPGKDGFETCRDIRAGGITTPVIFLTTKAYADDKERALAVGGNAFLIKPFSTQKLDAVLRLHLG